jgi:uncharacterized membrane protein
MSGSAVPGYPSPVPYPEPSVDPRHVAHLVLTVVIVVTGVALVIGLMSLMFTGFSWHGPMMGPAPWDALTGFVVLVIVLIVVLGIVRGLVWTTLWGPRPGWYYRHAYRHGFVPGGPLDPDPAVRIARERLARGEISSAQSEQLLRDLGHGGPGPLR